ncbi:BTAD domain-containing putative transcriptional regulator [Streptomyces sp. NPDC020898]|uniref:AfsR/SARP family transcriptional regulator n=1 Tax=Streptomyces sp. NPDC020898 TaxID=3365101 RepID=UPI003787746D
MDRAFLGELLAHAGRAVSIDHIIESIWPHNPPVNRANAVYVRVSRLRSLFRSMAGPASDQTVITTQPGAYLLTPEECDARRFEQLLTAGMREQEKGFLDSAAALLDRALSLWEGEAFTDVASECVVTEAGRLTELRLVALERQAEVLLALGAHSQVVNVLKPVAERHPLRETLHGHLMAALHASGRSAEALATYARLRSTLVEELGTEPAATLRDLHWNLLRHHSTDTDGPVVRVSAAAAPSRWSPPAQLPGEIADFVPGEDMELVADVLTKSGRATAAVTAITGQGGAGKTTIAVHLARRLRSSFPDGQLYIGLGGGSPNPTEPAEALAQLLRSVGHPASALPEGVDARAACFRDRLDGRRVLVVLDNAADEAQIRDLLPGNAESGVIVTSRSWLTGIPFDARVEHNRMSPCDAVLLLSRVAGADRTDREPTAVREVARLCDHLPLALRIAGARLAARPHWSVGDLVQRLTDGSGLLTELTHGALSVRSCFEPAYHRLAEGDRRMFRVLGLSGAGVYTGFDGAVLLGRPEAEAAEALERLTDARLLSVSHPGRRGSVPTFRLSGLAGAYARERADIESPESERDQAAVSACALFKINLS